MAFPGGLGARVFIMVLLTAASCGRPAGPADGSGSPTATESPSPTSSPSAAPSIELRTDGLGAVEFGRPMEEAFPILVELLGPPVDEIRVHGDLPYGYGDLDSTVRRVDFGGLYAVFGDWETPYRDDGRMHLIGWGAFERRTANGTRPATPEGITMGASVAELRAAFGPSLDLTVEEGCGGAWWYFWVASESPYDLLVSLTGPPTDTASRLDGMTAGAQREGFVTC